MKNLPYALIALAGGAIIPLQLAMVNAFRQSSHASQIQATFYLYLGGTTASLLLAFIISGGIRPPNMQNAEWWQYLTGFLGSFYILFMFIAAPKLARQIHSSGCFWGKYFLRRYLPILGGLVCQSAKSSR